MKAGLMGSFAAIGDSVFAALIPTIFGALAANMATDSNPVGILIWILAQVAVMVFRWKQLEFAYKEGISPSYHDAITLDCIDRCGYFTRSFHGWSVSSNHDQC